MSMPGTYGGRCWRLVRKSNETMVAQARAGMKAAKLAMACSDKMWVKVEVGGKGKKG